MADPERVLLLTSKRTYRDADIRAAALELGVRLTLGTDRCKGLARRWKDEALRLDLNRPERCARTVREAHAERPFSAIVPTDDQTAELAAHLAAALGLRSNPPEAAAVARHKGRLRACLSRAGVAQPRFLCAPLPEGDGPVEAAAVAPLVAAIEAQLGWPVVVKPLLLTGSRGVMRVDNPEELRGRLHRLRRLLQDPDLPAVGDPDHRQVLVEEFIPGVEVAVESVLRDGRLEVLAFFDKPDPLDGPYFEETLYVTPSRVPAAVQQATVEAVQQAARAMGLSVGPVHAELRLRPTPQGLQPVVIEAAARSIGGLCSRVLRFGTGRTLDAVVLEALLGRSTAAPPREAVAAGVMMLPIPKGGVFHGVNGVDEARAVPGVRDLTITVREGEELVPLPEGASYLGFLFAQGDTPEQVEQRLRAAHGKLVFNIHSSLPRLSVGVRPNRCGEED